MLPDKRCVCTLWSLQIKFARSRSVLAAEHHQSVTDDCIHFKPDKIIHRQYMGGRRLSESRGSNSSSKKTDDHRTKTRVAHGF